jgi:hypothetical protein
MTPRNEDDKGIVGGDWWISDQMTPALDNREVIRISNDDQTRFCVSDVVRPTRLEFSGKLAKHPSDIAALGLADLAGNSPSYAAGAMAAPSQVGVHQPRVHLVLAQQDDA